MVILVPKEGTAIKPTHEYLYYELEKAAEEQMKLAFKNYKNLTEVFGSPDDAVKQFFEKYTPDTVQDMADNMNKWLDNFKTDVIKGQIEELVNKQMKMAFKQYEELGEIFKSPEEATREFIKKYAPENAQKVMADVEAWIEKVAPKTVRDELQSAAEEHMKLAFKQYEHLRKTFGTPDKATEEFMEKYTPASVKQLRDNMNTWLDSFVPGKKKPKK
jgi:thiaminase